MCAAALLPSPDSGRDTEQYKLAMERLRGENVSNEGYLYLRSMDDDTAEMVAHTSAVQDEIELRCRELGHGPAVQAWARELAKVSSPAASRLLLENTPRACPVIPDGNTHGRIISNAPWRVRARRVRRRSCPTTA